MKISPFLRVVLFSFLACTPVLAGETPSCAGGGAAEVPAIPQLRGKTFILSPCGPADENSVKAVEIADSRSDLARVSLADGRVVPCVWGEAEIPAPMCLLILRERRGEGCYTILFTFTSQTEGTYLLDSPRPADAPANLALPMVRGTFSLTEPQNSGETHN